MPPMEPGVAKVPGFDRLKASIRRMSHNHQYPPCCGVSTNIEDYFQPRRQFLQRTGMGLGALALGTLLDPSDLAAAQASTSPLMPRPPHFPGKAKSIIQIFASGAPSHVDTWDP